jgi:hypothetical protein
MKKILLNFICLFSLFTSCKKNEVNNIDVEVINNTFKELINDEIFVESFLEYEKRTGNDVNNFSSFEELYELYQGEKKEFKNRNVYIYSWLRPIKDSVYNDNIELKSPWHRDIKEYTDLHKPKLKFNPKIDIQLPEGLNLASYEESDFYFSFSRVHFNENKDKAFFLFEIARLEEDYYSLSIVFVEMKEEKWEISEVKQLVVS